MKLYINKSEYGYSSPLVDKEKTCKYYLQLGFKKGEEPTTDHIDVKECFMTVFNSKKGSQPKLVVMSFEDIGTNLDEKEALYNTKATTKADPYSSFGDTIEIDPSEDLPF